VLTTQHCDELPHPNVIAGGHAPEDGVKNEVSSFFGIVIFLMSYGDFWLISLVHTQVMATGQSGELRFGLWVNLIVKGFRCGAHLTWQNYLMS
jgi:hypothetical protein